MAGDFMVSKDRFMASACFDPANVFAGTGAPPPQLAAVAGGRAEGVISDGKKGIQTKKKKKSKGGGGGAEAIECRICQEEGEESDMESPCACNGTLKFAHRKCIQRWCNKKGDITCEICNQIYAPNYSSPPSRTNSDVMVIDIRQSWASGVDLHDPHYLALAAADRELLHVDYEDYTATSNSSISCCRSVALILMLLLLIRHVLLIARDLGGVQETTLFDVSLLQFLVFLLPCYVVVCSCYNILIRRRRQV